MTTKSSEISSGLVAVAHMMQSPDGKCMGFLPFEEEGTAPVVRLSDAEAIISAKDAEIAESDHIRDRCAHLLAETAVALKGPEKALHRHGWQDLPEVAAKQSAALKLARSALMHDGYPCGNGCKCRACEALAAINEVLKGE